MDNIKNDTYYVNRIINDLKFVIEHTKNKTKEEIENNELLVDSIMFRIIQISENNAYLSNDFKLKHPNVPWAAIKGMRNRIVHAYGNINLTIVYDTVINGIPQMYEELIKVL